MGCTLPWKKCLGALALSRMKHTGLWFSAPGVSLCDRLSTYKSPIVFKEPIKDDLNMSTITFLWPNRHRRYRLITILLSKFAFINE